MRHSIHCELKRMFFSKTFKVSVLVVCAFVLTDIVQNTYWAIIDMNDCSVFHKWIGSLNDTFGSVAFNWVFPILASLPYAWTMGEELNSGYAHQVLIRTSKKDYFISKLVTSFISGGLVIVIALILHIMLLTMICRTYLPNQMILFPLFKQEVFVLSYIILNLLYL